MPFNENDIEAIHQLSEEQIMEYHEAFNLFDVNKDGTLSKSEVTTVCRSLGLCLNPRELNTLFLDLDKGNSGRLSFEEFLQLVARSLEAASANEEDLLTSFRILDMDNSGLVSSDELKNVLGRIGTEKLDPGMIDQMIQEADINGDGKLSYNEFVYLLMAKAV